MLDRICINKTENKSIIRCKNKIEIYENKIRAIKEWAVSRGYIQIPPWYDCGDLFDKLFFYKRILEELECKYLPNPFKIGDYVRNRNYAFIIKKFERNYAVGENYKAHILSLTKVLPKTAMMKAQDAE